MIVVVVAGSVVVPVETVGSHTTANDHADASIGIAEAKWVGALVECHHKRVRLIDGKAFGCRAAVGIFYHYGINACA